VASWRAGNFGVARPLQAIWVPNTKAIAVQKPRPPSMANAKKGANHEERFSTKQSRLFNNNYTTAYLHPLFLSIMHKITE
jgi:hypothetical protein